MYRTRGSPVFLCSLDASKAFHRVNHATLFNVLLQRNIPVYIVRILAEWYSSQQLCVRWGSIFSGFFSVTNGVRQGGILSPRLFNLYIDNLSKKLMNTKSGCNVAGMMINHLIYADDLLSTDLSLCQSSAKIN